MARALNFAKVTEKAKKLALASLSGVCQPSPNIRRYPGKLELRAPQGATPVTLRMQALTAARFDDVLAHVSFMGTGSEDSRLYPLWDQTRIWDPGD